MPNKSSQVLASHAKLGPADLRGTGHLSGMMKGTALGQPRWALGEMAEVPGRSQE